MSDWGTALLKTVRVAYVREQLKETEPATNIATDQWPDSPKINLPREKKNIADRKIIAAGDLFLMKLASEQIFCAML